MFAIVLAMLAIAFNSAVIGQQSSLGDEKSEQTRIGNISGTVVNEGGQPIAYASVFVRSFGSSGQGRSTSTDREGNFQVTGLDPVAYLVSASMPAYTSAPRDPDSDQPTFYRIGDSVRLQLVKGGIITGTVTTTVGEPVIGVAVRAYLIRDVNNRPSRYSMPFRAASTDDRGVYRIYGLTPGTYVVSAGGVTNSYSSYGGDAYATDVPTFAPSSSRDTANEITVRVGEETNNVDIRYRGESGHIVSGIASGMSGGASAGYTIVLTSVFNGESQSSNSSYQPPGSQGFAFYGIADGDYYLTAQLFGVGGDWAISEHRQVRVRGAHVTGIELPIKTLGSITGHISLEESNAPECKDKRRLVFAETLITPWHNEKDVAKDQPRFPWALGGPIFPDKQGGFTIRNLVPGQYRFNVRTLAKYWYLRSISLSSSATSATRSSQDRSIDAARNWTNLKFGQRISALNIALAAGAASIRGQIKLSEGKQIAPRLFIYLIPAERERADDVLRYFASRVAADGTFAFNHLPPGRYRILAKGAADDEFSISSRVRLPEEVDLRTKLRQEAEAAKSETELKPCQNLTGFQLTLE